MHAIAPGKVIISGEHSAVYGAPALAVATRRYIHAHFKPASTAELQLAGDLLDARYSLDSLHQLADLLDQRFNRFLQGELSVSSLLDSPDQLIAYVLSHQSLSLTGELSITSELPTGAGMGSSAAAIAATLLLVEQLSDISLTDEQRFETVRHCERLQHGRGSAIDAAAVIFGGLVRVQAGKAEAAVQTLGEGWFQLNSGIPVVSTGECVQQVRKQFADSDIWDQFAQVTDQLQLALNADTQKLHGLVRQNHRLLLQIGVVPDRVARFINQAEQLDISVKVSGAGAIAGDNAGQLLAYAPDAEPALRQLCTDFNYSCDPLLEDSDGARTL